MRMAPASVRSLDVVLPPGWSRPRGYSNGLRVPAGRDLLFVAGQIGWDEAGRLVGSGFIEQFERALRNCVTVVEAAGGSAADIVRLTLFCADRLEYSGQLAAVGEAYRRVMGGHYPSMSLIEVAALLEEGARIEIEATAALAPAEAGPSDARPADARRSR
jgi:enamine deaminase RidA (YjgF/YER057c/UK114 family)